MKNKLRLLLFMLLSLLLVSVVYGAVACSETQIDKSSITVTASQSDGCGDWRACNMIDGDTDVSSLAKIADSSWLSVECGKNLPLCNIDFTLPNKDVSKVIIRNLKGTNIEPPVSVDVYFGNTKIYNGSASTPLTIHHPLINNVASMKIQATENPSVTGAWAISEVEFYEYTNYIANEVCDGVDNDCDALVDEEITPRTKTCGVGACKNTVTEGCYAGAWAVGCTGGNIGNNQAECDKFNGVIQCFPIYSGGTACSCKNFIFPNATTCISHGGTWYGSCTPNFAAATTEVCDGIDNDCDGEVDEGYACDFDRDGFFKDPKVITTSPRFDCNDNDALINPDAKERFNGLDDDCDVEVDEGLLWKQKIITNTKGSKCVMKGNLNCTIGSGDSIQVYQEINHLLPGKYKFSFDNLSRNIPSVDIRTFSGITEGATNLCQNFGQKHYCEFEISESKSQINIRIKLGFTAPAVVDNAMLQLVDPANDKVFQYDPRFNMSSIDIETFISIDRPASCCPIDYCWNGDKCIDSSVYMTNVSMPPLVMDANGNGYRCIKKKGSNESEWTYSEKKYTPFKLDSGYCPYEDMCLVTTEPVNLGDIQSPHYGCAKSGEFVANSQFNYIINPNYFEYNFDNHFKDFYCNAGNWTSRTKLLAMKLMEIGNSSGENFMLFCDRPGQLPKENQYDEFSSLNYYGYSTERLIDLGLPLQMFDNDINLFNNFCALIINTNDKSVTGDVFDAEDTVIIGASMNNYFNDYIEGTSGPKVNDLFQELFKGNCTGKITDKNKDFSRCTNNLYYNNHTMTFIYSTKQNYLGQNTDILTGKEGPLRSIINFFVGIIDYFKNLLKGLFVEDGGTEGNISIGENYLLSEDLYTRVYYSKIGTKEIQGVAQKGIDLSYLNNKGEMVDYAYLKFINYNYGICNFSESRGRFVLNVPFEDEEDKDFQSEILRNYTDEYTCNITGDVENIVIVGTNLDYYDNSIDELWYDLTARTRLQR